METKKTVEIEARVNAPVEKVWELYNKPEHVVHWNHASDDWHSPKAENDFRPGGGFNYRMEARDGSFGFDFYGTYDSIVTNKLVEYTIGDGRKTAVSFTPSGSETLIIIRFEAEATNPVELQRDGWQAILNNFKKYSEKTSVREESGGVSVTTQKIIPHLWFDREAREAAEFYVSVFDDSGITSVSTINDTPSGDADIVEFKIMGFSFTAISAGPFFRINSSISFHVRCRSVEEVEKIWKRLLPGGTVMMELGEYPFSKRYGWIQDRFGVSWQVIHTEGDFSQRIMPVLMFTGEVCGRAEEAVGFYKSVFGNTRGEVLARYEKGESPDIEGSVKYAHFMLEGQEFASMDSARVHNIKFNEGISLIVKCRDQEEIDYFWDKLSAVAESEQCGWIKDKFGVSWQIVPENLDDLLGKNHSKTVPAMLSMKKIIISDLLAAGSK